MLFFSRHCVCCYLTSSYFDGNLLFCFAKNLVVRSCHWKSYGMLSTKCLADVQEDGSKEVTCLYATNAILIFCSGWIIQNICLFNDSFLTIKLRTNRDKEAGSEISLINYLALLVNIFNYLNNPNVSLLCVKLYCRGMTFKHVVKFKTSEIVH